MTDRIPWFDSLDASSAKARELRAAEHTPAPPLGPCRCGARRGHHEPDPAPPADLRGDAPAVVRADSLRRCRTCRHGIHVGQTCIERRTATARGSYYLDHYHPECAVIS